MNPNFGQMNVPAGLSNVVAIAAGPAISLALKTMAQWLCGVTTDIIRLILPLA